MARILFLTQILPYPLTAGARVRAYHMLRHLSREHEVTLVSFRRGDDTEEAIQHLRSVCHGVYVVPMRRSLRLNLRAAAKGLLTGLPMVITRDEIGEMADLIRRLVSQQQFDVVHADQLSMAGYGRLAVHTRAASSVLDEHNAVYLLARRMAAIETNPIRRAIATREGRAFVRYEREICRQQDAVLTVTPEDREHLLSLYGGEERARLESKFSVVPISVDPDQVAQVKPHQTGQPMILHVGTMFWPPNVAGVIWFARQVLPLVRQQLPDASFVIVGKDPPPAVLALAEDPQIQVAGYVADLEPYLSTAGVLVVPLHAGGGMRVKILDAWLWGLPVVSTSIGAEGIQTHDGENIMLADDPAIFAQATVRLLTDNAANQRFRAAGRAWVEANYAWPVVYRQVDGVYARLLKSPQTGCVVP